MSAIDPEGRRVLDPCCGGRMMWFDRQHQDVVFGDIRRETITVTDRSHGRTDGTRELLIEPDTLLDFRALPFSDGAFKLVVFDPPHLVKAGAKSWLAAKYGKLSDNWRDDLKLGFAECFRVLAVDGVLVFKWNETQIKLRDILALTPFPPLFGHPSGRKGLTHWCVFMKPVATVTTVDNNTGSDGDCPGWPACPNGLHPLDPAHWLHFQPLCRCDKAPGDHGNGGKQP